MYLVASVVSAHFSFVYLSSTNQLHMFLYAVAVLQKPREKMLVCCCATCSFSSSLCLLGSLTSLFHFTFFPHSCGKQHLSHPGQSLFSPALPSSHRLYVASFALALLSSFSVPSISLALFQRHSCSLSLRPDTLLSRFGSRTNL